MMLVRIQQTNASKQRETRYLFLVLHLSKHEHLVASGLDYLDRLS
jgi:hypothetical protein